MSSLCTRDSTLVEVELIRRIGQGDRGAFGQIYDLYSGLLFSFATHVLNDDHEAENVVQEVFLKIWETAPSFNECLGSPLSWALTMTRSRSFDRLRTLQALNPRNPTGYKSSPIQQNQNSSQQLIWLHN